MRPRANRRLFRRPQSEYFQVVERWISRGAHSAQITKVEASEAPGAEFRFQVEFAAPRYAQLMQGRLMLFRPVIVPRDPGAAFAETARKYPIVLEAESFAETVRVHLPEAFAVDEIPGPAKISMPFGAFEASWLQKGTEIVFTRKLLVQAVEVPAERHAEVRGFFKRIAAAEDQPIVLVRK